ncbi:MAG: hypothetical protein H7X95_05270, partial [Deltaproteobacteria bacterium]|nr:hypothetical protein [Deltaproteobacteria bacterium]
FMREAAAFYEDFMILGADGKYVFSPSHSPENSPAGSEAQACTNATMDMAVARELFVNLIAATSTDRTLHGSSGDDDGADVDRWHAIVSRLPDYQINADGAIKEWLHPDLADNHDHRHVSHLYALFDGLPADIEARPDLRAAFLRTVERRLEIRRQDAGGVMAFGLAQLGLVAASLRQPALCGEILDWLARKYWRPSLVTTHDPGQLFNVDLCGGFPALIAKLLVDSRPGHIEIFPALPPAWPKGTVHGLPARGGITIDRLSWDPEGIQVTLSAVSTQSITIAFPAQSPHPPHVVTASFTDGSTLNFRVNGDEAPASF